MKLFLLIAILACLVSCNKEPSVIAEPVAKFDARYTISIQLNWQNPEFTVPASAHVTALVGMAHSRNTSLWKTGIQATKGVEDVAEEGNNVNINLELDAFIADKKALSKFMFPAPPVVGGTDTSLSFNQNFSCFSFISMIAPSPDWFMGLYNVDLFQNSNWVKDTTVSLLLYDAGTENGDTFGYSNPETVPRQNISLLTPANAMVLANGNAVIAAFGTVRFIKD